MATTNSATIYTYRMPWGETLRISADLVRADATIYYAGAEDGEGEVEWVSTPYQTAHARHQQGEMLRLVVEYLGADWYADPSDDADHETQLRRAVEGAELVSEDED